MKLIRVFRQYSYSENKTSRDVFLTIFIRLAALIVATCYQLEFELSGNICETKYISTSDQHIICTNSHNPNFEITDDKLKYPANDSFTLEVEQFCTKANKDLFYSGQKKNYLLPPPIEFKNTCYIFQCINCVVPVNSSLRQLFSQIYFHVESEMSIQPTSVFTLNKLIKLTLITNPTYGPVIDIFDEILNLENITIGYDMKILNTDVFVKHHKLQSLGLIHNQFDRLTKKSFQGVSQIDELRLISNDIHRIDSDAFEHITNLRKVLMSGNRISALPKGLFAKNGNLSRFEMFCANMETLPDELFAHMPKLMYIIVRCNMTWLPENLFNHSDRLDVIDLSYNSFKTLPTRLFDHVHTLNLLNLEHNLLPSFRDGILDKTEFVRELKLSNNNFTKFFCQEKLNTSKSKGYGMVDLSNNRITTLHKLNITCALLHDFKINLSNNLITEIGESILQDITNYHGERKSKFILAGNPFDCGCNKIKQIIHLTQYSSMRVLDIDRLKCVTPENKKNRDVRSITSLDLICGYRESKGCNYSIHETQHIMIMNCSNANLTKFPTLPTYSEGFEFEALELYIDHNAITELPKLNTKNLSYITKIIARNNSIEKIRSENIPMNLTTLDLSNNNLSHISRATALTLNSTTSLQYISFVGNEWSCDCGESSVEKLSIAEFLFIKGIIGLKDIKCKSGILAMVYIGQCSAMKNIIITALIVLLFTVLVCILYYRNQQAILVWFYAHNICMCCISEDDLDSDKPFDAFVSYARQEDDFVHNELLPELENGPNSFKILNHLRDWIPGEFINTQIMLSVEKSCRTIIVLSTSYLESIWGKMEFRVAHTNSMRDGRVRLIVIMYNDVSDVTDLDPEIKAYLNTNTYLKWGDPRFFDKLRYALPHRRRLQSRGYHRPQPNEMKLTELQALSDKPT